MQLIYHKQTGKLSGKNPEDDYHVILGGKEYHIVVTRYSVIIYNDQGDRLWLDK